MEYVEREPDSYIGSLQKQTQTLWAYENGEMVHRPITFVPGLYAIFDHILVNAAGNKRRHPEMDALRVTIDVEQSSISVFNNGRGVPVEVVGEEMLPWRFHRKAEREVYWPEMTFGHFLTVDYKARVKKVTGGGNGYGAKLANFFSTEFVIETADGQRLKKYKQVFTNNMRNKNEPVISECEKGENWTKVTFKPDLSMFNMTHLEEDVVALMKKRVIDMAGSLGKSVEVELNGMSVPVKSFFDYVDLYLESANKSRDTPLPRMTEVNGRWEICVSASDVQFQQVSLVNSIATIKGGTHVDYITDQITNYVMNVVNKKNKNADLKAHNVKNYLWVFVNARIDKPVFDNRMKETLIFPQIISRSKRELTPAFLSEVLEEIFHPKLEFYEKRKKDLLD